MTRVPTCRSNPRPPPTRRPSPSCCSTQPFSTSVTASGTTTRELEDGRLEVIVQLRNRENRRIEVQANCVFKDINGFSTGDETPFKTVILTENATEDLQFVSANAKARRYTVRVRQAR